MKNRTQWEKTLWDDGYWTGVVTAVLVLLGIGALIYVFGGSN